MKSLIFIFCILIELSGTVQQCLSSPGGKPRRYLSKDEVDTTIQRGFIMLNESADMAGVGFNHNRSITEAKKIVKRLKEMARGDPNERYVLWKAGELEAQIYLEESDLVLQQMRQRQMTINELVDKYNAEVGKWRPDFATLYRIHKSMEQVDVSKANEIADSFNKRKRALSREVVYFLEKMILAANADSARKELGYLLRNRLYLDVSQSVYRRLEDRVEKLVEAVEAKPLIEAGAASAGRLLDKRDIGGARLCLDTARNRFSSVKADLSQTDEMALSSLLKRAGERLEALEDSLVDVNIAILRMHGIKEADNYLRTVLRTCGVSHEKAALVDRMIISVKSPESVSAAPKIDETVNAFNSEEGDERLIDDIMVAARKKAQEKRDSLQAVENERLRRENLQRNRNDTVAAVAVADLAASRPGRQRADSIAMAVYILIENNNTAGARKLFEKEKRFLENNQRPDEYGMLKTTLDYFTAETEKTAVIAYLKPVEEKVSAPKRADPAASDLQANLERAQEEIRGIYTMLERNDIDRAYRRFQTNMQPLRKYLTPEAFNMLQTSVEQAYADYAGKRQ